MRLAFPLLLRVLLISGISTTHLCLKRWNGQAISVGRDIHLAVQGRSLAGHQGVMRASYHPTYVSNVPYGSSPKLRNCITPPWRETPDRAHLAACSSLYRNSHSYASSEDDESCQQSGDQDAMTPEETEETTNEDALHDVTHDESVLSKNAADGAFLDATDPSNEWYERELIDRCKVMAVGGRGGNGCVSFRREKHVPLGGADGGNGGPGGSVYLICDATMSNLNPVKQFYVYKAENGKHGCGERQNGAKGKHRYIRVPPGTHVYSLEGKLYAVLQKTGDRLMIVRGGRGGKGNRYYKSKFNVAPKICEMGEEGKTREVVLNYKLVGNVALVGKPNSGKSSILRCLSNARPRVADYAFSTKFPIVGVMDVEQKNDVIDCGADGTAGVTDDTAVHDINNDASNETDNNVDHSDLLSDSAEDLIDSDQGSDSGSTGGYSDYDTDGLSTDGGYEDFADINEDEYTSSSEETYNASDDVRMLDGEGGEKYLCLYGYRAPQLCSAAKNKSNEIQANGSSNQNDPLESIMQNLRVKRVSKEKVEMDDLNTVSEGSSSSDDDGDTTTYNDTDDTDDDAFENVDDLDDICDVEEIPEQEPKKQLVIADVPGLIEGASEGRGLGHKFLKHIENCNVLAYVVDASLDDPLADYISVRNEVGLFNESLLSRLHLILLNKVDLIDAERAVSLVEAFKNECKHDKVYTVSAKTRENIDTVKVAFSHIYQDPIKNDDDRRDLLDMCIDNPDDFRRVNPRKFKVEKVQEGEFRIKSDYLDRKIPMMRFDQRETLDKLRRILRINRIHHKLKRMGVKAGDVIHIGKMSFCVNELAY